MRVYPRLSSAFIYRGFVGYVLLNQSISDHWSTLKLIEPHPVIYLYFLPFFFTATCGSVINASAGEGDIDVKRYPFHYLNGFHRNGICAWTIEAEEDEVIQLLITALYIRTVVPEAGYSDSSYLEIYDGVQTESSLLVR